MSSGQCRTTAGAARIEETSLNRVLFVRREEDCCERGACHFFCGFSSALKNFGEFNCCNSVWPSEVGISTFVSGKGASGAVQQRQRRQSFGVSKKPPRNPEKAGFCSNLPTAADGCGIPHPQGCGHHTLFGFLLGPNKRSGLSDPDTKVPDAADAASSLVKRPCVSLQGNQRSERCLKSPHTTLRCGG